MNLVSTGVEEAEEDAHDEWALDKICESFLGDGFCELGLRGFSL